MTPLEMIEKGLTSGDMQLIANGYRAMTGKDVVIHCESTEKTESLPKRKGRPPKKLATEEDYSTSEVKKKINFIDDGSCRADVAIDKKLAVQPPVPRRKPFTLAKVNCQDCGSQYSIHPLLVRVDEETKQKVYTCEKCLNRKGNPTSYAQ